MPVEQAIQSAERRHLSNFIRHLMEFLSGEYRQKFLPHILLYQKHLGILG